VGDVYCVLSAAVKGWCWGGGKCWDATTKTTSSSGAQRGEGSDDDEWSARPHGRCGESGELDSAGKAEDNGDGSAGGVVGECTGVWGDEVLLRQ
jgi:hypothetical protein